MVDCLFCKKSEVQMPKLKPMQEKQWNTAKHASIKRKFLKKDQYNDATIIIQTSETHEQYWYHSKCLSYYSAVKKKAEPDPQSPEIEPPTKVTRSKSNLSPSTSRTGVFGNECVFCPFLRRRTGSSQTATYEKPRAISSKNSASAIVDAAKHQDNDTSRKILAIPGDLLAKEVKCHDSCKREFIRAGTTMAQPSTKDEGASETSAIRIRHTKAFEELSLFLKEEIIQKHRPLMASTIFNLYREEYLGVGGTLEEFSDYSVQSLMNKIKKITGIQIDKKSNKTGSFVFPSSMTIEEATILVRNSSVREEDIRCAAMTIRAEIALLPKTELPSPTSIHTIKEMAPAIPPLTDLFFRTVMNGLNQSNAPETSERKITAMASDAIFNSSRGSIRPWKNTVLGLGISSLTGSKTAITVLNRQGHAISYPTVKELETEIAYSCSSEDRDTPSGLAQSDILATGMYTELLGESSWHYHM